MHERVLTGVLLWQFNKKAVDAAQGTNRFHKLKQSAGPNQAPVGSSSKLWMASSTDS